MTTNSEVSSTYVEMIRESGMSIYDPIDVGDPRLWIPTGVLEEMLADALIGVPLGELPIRSRSKAVKELICKALGYPVPRRFTKTRPRFPGQFFDTYVQKSNNLQIWNEEISPARRYVIVRPSEDGGILNVRVISGDQLASLSTTGTLTTKYQARFTFSEPEVELFSVRDTENLQPVLSHDLSINGSYSPVDQPRSGQIMPIADLFVALSPIVGERFPDVGHDQERNRGADLHRLVTEHLGYADYRDDGRFPDVRHQLLEVKLQTSATIDLGVIRPDSNEPLELERIDGLNVAPKDVRYAVFGGATDGIEVSITHFCLITGESFFERFPQFQGNVVNRKIQIRLPANFFDR